MSRPSLLFALAALPLGAGASFAIASCHDGEGQLTPAPVDAGSIPLDAHEGGTHDAAPAGPFCGLPGAVQWTPEGVVVVPGGPAQPDLTWLKLPTGFCSHAYATVPNARQLRFAPGGDLFVASPSTLTTGGGPNGRSAIVIAPDDDGDGLADTTISFLGGLPSTQGLLFANDHFYYQDHTRILRIPFQPGDRAPRAGTETVIDIQVYISSVHWPKTLDQSSDGTIYVANGGDEGESCTGLHELHGAIFKVDGTPGGAEVTKGFRNPIAVRCAGSACYALELAKDYSGNFGGREKLVPIRQGDDWGYPCCATKDISYPITNPVPDCSMVTAETDSFLIGDTPFGLDFEPGRWPAPYRGSVIVALHGAFGSWAGSRVVAVATDPATGAPLPGTTIDGGSSGSFTDFATGWDDGSRLHGRPAAVVFAPDGRLFLANDADGSIVWIAPMGM